MIKSKFCLKLFSALILLSSVSLQAHSSSSSSSDSSSSSNSSSSSSSHSSSSHRSGCSHLEDGWNFLQAQNQVFINDPRFILERAETAGGQNPNFVVLSCADSRTPPELIFNQGLGRIFCPRVAGNTAGDQVIDSIAFAVHTWDVNTVVVMGHENCGAVEGALARLRKNHGCVDRPDGIFNAVLIPIERAIVAAGIDIYASDALEQSVEANVAYVAKRLIKKSRIISDALHDGQIAIVGSVYNLSSGKARTLFIVDKCHPKVPF